MDITYYLQKPSQKHLDGTVKCGGYRDLIPYMGKMAISLGVNGVLLKLMIIKIRVNVKHLHNVH